MSQLKPICPSPRKHANFYEYFLISLWFTGHFIFSKSDGADPKNRNSMLRHIIRSGRGIAAKSTGRWSHGTTRSIVSNLAPRSMHNMWKTGLRGLSSESENDVDVEDTENVIKILHRVQDILGHVSVGRIAHVGV